MKLLRSIQLERKRRGWSQRIAAFVADINDRHFGRLERSEQTATVETAQRLEAALDTPINELFPPDPEVIAQVRRRRELMEKGDKP